MPSKRDVLSLLTRDELLAVVEGGPLLEPRQALLDAVAKRRHGRAPQQRIVGLDIGIDGQHLDAVRSQEPGQRGNGEVRRRWVTGRRIDEGDLHGELGTEQYPRSMRRRPFGPLRLCAGLGDGVRVTMRVP